MKRYWTLSLLLFVLSCSQDDDGPWEPDFFVYDDMTRAPFSQVISRYEQDQGQYRVELLLLGPTISYNEEQDAFSGTGDMIRLDFVLEGAMLAPGQYRLSFPGDFTTGIVAINFNLEEAEPGEDGFFDFLAEGSITLELAPGNEYLLRFDLIDDAGRSFRGKYSGAIPSFEKARANFFEYGGEALPSFVGVAQRVAEEEENYDVDLMLISPGITYHPETNTFSGIGNILRFDFTLSVPRPVAGEYTIDFFKKEPETLYLGMVGINVDASTGAPLEDGVFYFISEGTLTLSMNEDDYTFEFDLVDPENNSVKGRYQGPIEIDWKL